MMTTTATASAITIMTASPDPQASDLRCIAFLMCDNQAIGWFRSIDRQWRPCCGRCARALDYLLAYQCLTCGRHMPAGEALTSYPCGDPVPWQIECTTCAEGHTRDCASCAVAEREALED